MARQKSMKDINKQWYRITDKLLKQRDNALAKGDTKAAETANSRYLRASDAMQRYSRNITGSGTAKQKAYGKMSIDDYEALPKKQQRALYNAANNEKFDRNVYMGLDKKAKRAQYSAQRKAAGFCDAFLFFFVPLQKNISYGTNEINPRHRKAICTYSEISK